MRGAATLENIPRHTRRDSNIEADLLNAPQASTLVLAETMKSEVSLSLIRFGGRQLGPEEAVHAE
jgi:hypothetical protein